MDRLGWTGNFTDRRRGAGSPDRRGREFSDSEVYKLHRGDGLGGRAGPAAGTSTAEIARADRRDRRRPGAGRLPQHRVRPRPASRPGTATWSGATSCTASATCSRPPSPGRGPRRRTTLLEVARRAADHVCDTFGAGRHARALRAPGDRDRRWSSWPGSTGEQRYLDQAALFVERRGHRHPAADIEFGRPTSRTTSPSATATVLRGHAVRALYLAGGAVDVAVETGDDELLAAVAPQWDAPLARRTYLTGGMGSRHPDEAFGDDFVLPPDRAYSETCAGVAAVMLAWRLLLATGDARYADLIERTLYNVVATSLARRRAGPSSTPTPCTSAPAPARGARRRGAARASAAGRARPWFEVSCCPPNVARLLASLSTYLATADDDGLQLHQYADAEIDTRLADGRHVGLRVRTDYPDDGVVAVQVTRTDGGPWSITLRVPDWATGAVLVTAAGRRPAPTGDVTVLRDFAVGEEIRLELPMRARFTRPDPRIDAVRGCVAVERGPVVLCAEAVGGDAGHLDALRVHASADPVDDGGSNTPNQ